MVSIIIPTFNRSKALITVLKSIQCQTYKDWECIIVDDGSDEVEMKNIKKAIQNYPKICFYSRPNELRKGPSSCRNFGLNQATGDYIQFFDDDDYMFPNMLETKLRLLIEADVDVVVAPLQFVDFERMTYQKVNTVISSSGSLIRDYVLGNISWYVSGPMWKSEFLKENFDSNIEVLDDWDFNLRQLYRSPRVTYYGKPLQYYYRYSEMNTLSTVKNTQDCYQTKSAFLVYIKHYQMLKNYGVLDQDMTKCLFSRMVFLLRSALENKMDFSHELFFKTIKVGNFFYLKTKMRISLGFLSYLIFNRGYRFIKVN